MGKESEIINEFKKIFKESKVHSTLRNISQKLEDIKGFDKSLINNLKSYVKKSEELKRMALTSERIFKNCKDLETKYHFSKLPFKDKLIEAFKDTDEDYAQQLTKDLDTIEKAFEPVPNLLKQLHEEIDKVDGTEASTNEAKLKKYLPIRLNNTIDLLFSRKGNDCWYENYKDFVGSSFDLNDDKHKYYLLKPEDKEKFVAEAKAVNEIYKSASKSTDVPTLIKIMKDLKDKLDKFKTNLEKAWKESVNDKTISTSQAQDKDETDGFLHDVKEYNIHLSNRIEAIEDLYERYDPDYKSN